MMSYWKISRDPFNFNGLYASRKWGDVFLFSWGWGGGRGEGDRQKERKQKMRKLGKKRRKKQGIEANFY